MPCSKKIKPFPKGTPRALRQVANLGMPRRGATLAGTVGGLDQMQRGTMRPPKAKRQKGF